MSQVNAKINYVLTAQDQSAKAFRSIERNMLSVEKAIGSMKAGFVALATGFVATSIVNVLQDAVDNMDALGKASQRVGLPTEKLSALKLAAQDSGVAFADLESNVTALNKKLAGIGGGEKNDASVALKAMGITAFTASGQLKNTDVVLGEVADKFQRYKDGAGEARLAANLFTKSGADMIPLLNAGRDGFAEAAQKADLFGLMVGGNAAAQATRFNDALQDLRSAFHGLVQQVVTAALPVLNEFAIEIDDWLRTAGGVPGVSQNISDGFGDIGKAAQRSMTYIREAGTLLEWFARVASDPLHHVEGSESLLDITDRFKRERAQLEIFLQQVVQRSGKTDLYDKATPQKPTIPAPFMDLAAGNDNLAKHKKQIDELAVAVNKLFSETRTPMEQYQERLRKIAELNDKGYFKGKGDLMSRAIVDAQNDYVAAVAAANTFTDAVENSFNALEQFGGIVQSSLGQALDSIASRTQSVSQAFRSMSLSILSEVTKMATNQALLMLFQGEHPLYGGGGGIFGNLLSGLGSYFGGGRAAGGAVSPGHSYVVGENGPEVLNMGSASGRVIANGRGGHAAPVININNYAGVQVTSQKNEQGGTDINIHKMVGESLVGHQANALGSYGVKRPLAKR
jgi:hypothetical protein